MDLDPRLRTNHAGQGPSSAGARHVDASSTSSPSNRLETNRPRAAPHYGADGPDSASTSLDSVRRQQQQRRQQQRGADHDAKKSRACEACRSLKVRCEPDPNDENAPCKRCGKAGRSCVVTMPTRKRQKKTDSRVSELEKKIDALTASLQARAAVPATGTAIGTATGTATGTGTGTGTATGTGTGTGSAAAPAGHGQQRMASWEGLPGLWTNNDSARMTASPRQRGQNPRPHRPSAVFEAAPDGTTGQGQRSDIIDRGIISEERAIELFQRYKEHMLRHLPAVVFPPSMPLMELRRSKPYLFLAVMAAASSETPGVQRVLQKELMELFAEKIVIVGEKNLELVQALQVAVIWYWPPEHFEELKFYQLIHMAAIMALDIGLGKKSVAKGGMAGFSWREQHNPFRRRPLPDPTSLESRRAWLTCHFLAANTAMSLHRPYLIRWSPFMTESLDMLRSSPDALPTDEYFCHLIWTHRMAENIGVQLSMDDADAAVNIMDARTQYTLGILERDLDQYIATVPEEMMQRTYIPPTPLLFISNMSYSTPATLKMGFCILNLYMHELAVHSKSSTCPSRYSFPTDVFQDGMINEKGNGNGNGNGNRISEPLGAAHINALSHCLGAIDETLQTFLAMDIPAIRCLPVFNFVRVAYAVVILMKMHFPASNPSSGLGKVINKDHMRVAYYLEALLDKFSATAADETCRPASKFLLVLVMLRTWFLKHAKSESRVEHPGPETPSQRPPSSPSANTPLQVLSEVAMGREPTPRALYNPLLPGPPQQPYYHDQTSMAADPPQQWMSQPPAPDMTIGFPAGFDFEALGVPLDGSGEMHGGGANMVLNDPLFSGMFHGLQDPDFFSP
ncbi:hypothetical protein EsDP_00000596 [Epichloe bromicola]|uniref:Zn(2)-C6 fungal-type domain-containing protein n=1 Tax=Epichloe bromicola TaxID=79588 RepID=A0ABQ0CFC9_9HYPO